MTLARGEFKLETLIKIVMDKKPGTPTQVVVMQGYSCSKGREFESWHQILERNIFLLILGKICTFIGKTKTTKKCPRVGLYLAQVIRCTESQFFSNEPMLSSSLSLSLHSLCRSLFLNNTQSIVVLYSREGAV